MNQRIDWHDWLKGKQDILWQVRSGRLDVAGTLEDVLEGVSGDDLRHDIHEQLPSSVPGWASDRHV